MPRFAWDLPIFVGTGVAMLTCVGFVDSPGLFVEAPVNVSVRVGTTATLRCQPPSSLASSKVTWEKDRQVLRSGGRIRILVRAGVHRFRIKNVLATDVASYVCVAGRSRSRAARLTVQEGISIYPH